MPRQLTHEPVASSLPTLPTALQRRLYGLAKDRGRPVLTVVIDLLEDALEKESPAAETHPTSAEGPVDWATIPEDELVSPREASQRLRLAVNTLAKMRVRGDGPPYVKLGPRSVFYRAGDIEAYRDARVRRSTAEG